jgi:hypothetical protein
MICILLLKYIKINLYAVIFMNVTLHCMPSCTPQPQLSTVSTLRKGKESCDRYVCVKLLYQSITIRAYYLLLDNVLSYPSPLYCRVFQFGVAHKLLLANSVVLQLEHGPRKTGNPN